MQAARMEPSARNSLVILRDRASETFQTLQLKYAQMNCDVKEKLKHHFQKASKLNLALSLLVACMFMWILFSSGSTTAEQDGHKSRSKRELTSDTVTGGAHIYTRWGRTTCPWDAHLLYHGYAAGAHASHIGGGSNYLCMPHDPLWANTNPSASTIGGYLYGVEYKLADGRFPFLEGGMNLQNHDAPCAVCLNPKPTVMIPARNQCYEGWQMQYRGYLMTSHYAHYRSEFVCVDEDPETVDGGYAAIGGAYWYQLETRCGSLPCTPYIKYLEVNCIVCTLI